MPLLRIMSQLAEIAIWQIASIAALIFRYDRIPDTQILIRSSALGLILFIFFRLAGLVDSILFGKYLPFSGDEFFSLFRNSVTLVFITSVPLLMGGGRFLPRSFGILTIGIALALTFIFRFSVRRVNQTRFSKRLSKSVIIYGAGFYSEMVVRQMLGDVHSEWRIHCLVDDNPTKLNLRMNGIKVLGNIDSLEGLALKFRPDTIVVAIANIESIKLEKIEEIATRNGITVSIVPSLSELLGKRFSLGDIRPLDEAVLIGRKLINRQVNKNSHKKSFT